MSDKKFDSNKFYRKDFNISPTDPILIIDDYYSDKNDNFYDIHYEYEVGIVVQGAVTRTYKDKQKTLRAGEIWITGIWEPHGFELEEIPSEMLCFVLSPESLSKILPIGFNWIKIFSQDSNSIPNIDDRYKKLVLEACSELKQVMRERSDVALAWKANILARILLYVAESNVQEYSRIYQNTDDMVEHDVIKNVVNLVFNTRGIVTVSEAASEGMMSTSHFSRLFKKVTGVTFAKFALGHRIKQSAISLTNTNEPIKKIATDWGFIDTSHYTKTFEKYFGVSPSKFRKQSKEARSTRGVTTTHTCKAIVR